MRLLLAEDDELLRKGIHDGLVQYGYTVDCVSDGAQAIRALSTNESFEVIILDLGLPKKSGLEVLKAIRSQGNTTPVLILTARDTVDDQVAGLDAGADDYVIKPFDFDTVCARIRALQRRQYDRSENILVHGNIELNPASHTVTLNGDKLILSRREFALLSKLLENIDRVVTRESMTQSLYGWEDEVDSNTIEVHIHNIRKKFGNELVIRTIRGVGYMVEKL